MNASKAFDTFVSRVIGISSLKASTTATAVSGLLQGCTVDTGCIVLPVTAPTVVVTCDGSRRCAVLTPTDWPMNTRVDRPLVQGQSRERRLARLDPQGRAATSELVQNILHPNNPPIDLPSWQYVTETGDTNSKPVDDALNTYDGQVVLFPMFDLTCGSDSDLRAGQGRRRTTAAATSGGNGSNQWYRIPQFGAFLLEHAYINGNDKAHCDTGNGATSCLIGRFVNFITTGTVGPGHRWRDDRRRDHRDAADQVARRPGTTRAEGHPPSALRFRGR